MSYSCQYTRDNYRYIIELSTEEYEEVIQAKKKILDAEKALSDLIKMYEKLEPSRVNRAPLCIDIDSVLDP